MLILLTIASQKIFNQEPVLQSLSENFNQLSALPANWTFASGWTINTQPGTLSKSLSILLNTIHQVNLFCLLMVPSQLRIHFHLILWQLVLDPGIALRFQ